jgi:hypothetical protein
LTPTQYAISARKMLADREREPLCMASLNAVTREMFRWRTRIRCRAQASAGV